MDYIKIKDLSINKLTQIFLFFAVFPILSLFLVSNAMSASFKVAPIRILLDKDKKSDILTIKNESGDKLIVQLSAFDWTQDSNGKDNYSKTKDIIFFPRIITLQKDEERIVRVGANKHAGAKEKTYRIFIEELPQKTAVKTSQVKIRLRVGIPVMVKPIKEEVKGKIEKLELTKGALNVKIGNTGNSNFIITAVMTRGLNKSGEEMFSKKIAGWYLLSGVSRAFRIEVPSGMCRKITSIDLEVVTDKFTLNDELNVNKAMCGH